ncbi:MAG: hypothetical protein R6W70_10575, partial [bacterium]
MHLSEIKIIAQYLDSSCRGSGVANIYHAEGGTLFKLFHGPIPGIFFHSEKNIIFPVSDLKKFKRS